MSAKRSVPQKPEPVNVPSSDEKRLNTVATLFEQGYRVKSANGPRVTISSPKGDTYDLDLEQNTCQCTAYYYALRRGNPTCKHLDGAPLLLLRCETHPVTAEMCCAARYRGLMSVREMPFVWAHFDNGTHQGDVILIDYLAAQGVALVKRFSDGPTYRVLLSQLTVDGLTKDHLERAETMRNRLLAAGPITGHVRQGNVRNWTGAGYR